MAKSRSSRSAVMERPDEIPIWKYFELVNPPIHAYTRAYLGEQFRAIMKSREEWDTELKEHMEE